VDRAADLFTAAFPTWHGQCGRKLEIGATASDRHKWLPNPHRFTARCAKHYPIPSAVRFCVERRLGRAATPPNANPRCPRERRSHAGRAAVPRLASRALRCARRRTQGSARRRAQALPRPFSRPVETISPPRRNSYAYATATAWASSTNRPELSTASGGGPASASGGQSSPRDRGAGSFRGHSRATDGQRWPAVRWSLRPKTARSSGLAFMRRRRKRSALCQRPRRVGRVEPNALSAALLYLTGFCPRFAQTGTKIGTKFDCRCLLGRRSLLRKWRLCRHLLNGAAQESNLPTDGLHRFRRF
jgi:hypothetical protein